jgi:hypothetical protein
MELANSPTYLEHYRITYHSTRIFLGRYLPLISTNGQTLMLKLASLLLNLVSFRL